MTETSILVQKFGGTSVATADSRRQVVEHIRRAREAGYQVAIVVSAIGRRGAPYATDTLLDLLRSDGGAVDPRDYDLIFVTGEIISVAIMSQTLKRSGIASVGLTGGQAGLHTDGHYREAEIVGIDVARLRRHMAAGVVPVIAGGQGIDPDSLDYTTLGRGASDTSGVAFGVALGAEKVEIFTDVEGVAATDPRMVPNAHWLARVSFPAMYELARFGAKVLHPRAILAGWRGQTPVVVRSTFSTAPGTTIGDVADECPIVGLATLSPMDTVWLPANVVDAETRARWERRLVIMSVIDAESGCLVAGIQASRRDELDQVLREAGVAALKRLPDAAWISLVGDPQVVGNRTGRDRECLAQHGIALSGFEHAGLRATHIVAANDLERAATALYCDAFEIAG
jgi:aspartate kinase